MTTITPLNHIATNSFIIQGAKTVLVDASLPNQEQRLIKALQQHHIDPTKLDYILLTHGHPDHTGSALALREQFGVPIVAHAGDLPMIQDGIQGEIIPLGIEGRLLKMTIPKTLLTFVPDIIINTPADYDALGIGGEMLHTPGHSDGSISILFDNNEAIIGDVLRGGYMNTIFPQQPRLPFFMPDMASMTILFESIQRLLDTNTQTFYVGHGGALYRDSIETWFKRVTNEPKRIRFQFTR